MTDLYALWSRLGVGFTVAASRNIQIDLEEVLVKTAQEGRNDSRLSFGMRGWLLKHHELVNSARLIVKLKACSETAVLGAIIDSVVQEHPRSNLKYCLKYCHPFSQKQFVFHYVSVSPAVAQLNLDENLPLLKKWGLISRELGDMQGAIRDKTFVLQHNPHLALRALFGANLKAEVLSFFLNHKQGNARQIALSIGLSYEPVYSELLHFKKIGLLKEARKGQARTFSLYPKFIKRTLLPLAA